MIKRIKVLPTFFFKVLEKFWKRKPFKIFTKDLLRENTLFLVKNTNKPNNLVKNVNPLKKENFLKKKSTEENKSNDIYLGLGKNEFLNLD